MRPKRNRITGWRKRVDQSQHSTALQKTTKESRCLGMNHSVQRSAEGAQWTWKKVTVVVSGAAENVRRRRMFPEISTEEKERSKKGKGFKGPGE